VPKHSNKQNIRLEAVPMNLEEANQFVRRFHRHSIPTVGCKFAFGAKCEEMLLRGVLIAGRPVSRNLDNGRILEVLRTCTDGTRNVNSFLYARSIVIAKAMGYHKVITYTLKSETGESLRAVGAKIVAEVPAGEWSCKSRPRKSQEVYKSDKYRWELWSAPEVVCNCQQELFVCQDQLFSL
jgi:hypothetical protein